MLNKPVADQLWIDPEIGDYLQQSGLRSLDDFLRFRDGQRVSRASKNPVLRFELETANKPRVCFLKQFAWRPRTLATELLKRRLPLLVGTSREYRLLHLLEDHGIPVVRVLAWGERRVAGMPTRGILLTEGVAGEEFVDCLHSAGPSMRRRLRFLHGALVGSLHSRGLVTKVRPTDLFVVSDDFSDFRKCLVVIDRERGLTRPRTMTLAERAGQLDDLWVKSGIITGLGTDNEQRAFLAGYENAWPSSSEISQQRRILVKRVFVQGRRLINRHPDSSAYREEFSRRAIQADCLP
jgi:tRNA A-37 threonylcarbamoyl transferase component Bud32